MLKRGGYVESVARTALPCVYQSFDQWTLLNFKSRCVTVSLAQSDSWIASPTFSFWWHCPSRVTCWGSDASVPWGQSPWLVAELVSGSQTLPFHPKSPMVLPEQSAYEPFINSLFQRGTLSHFMCHYLLAYAEHAGRPKCVGLQVAPSTWSSRRFIYFLIVTNFRVFWGWFIWAHYYFSVHFPSSSIIHSTNTHETDIRCWAHRDELGKSHPP